MTEDCKCSQLFYDYFYNMENTRNTVIPELKCLLSEVERSVGRCCTSNCDFNELSDKIERSTGELLSVSTLKRLWGYVPSKIVPRKSTLDILCQFSGYRNFDSFCEHIKAGGSANSRLFVSKTVVSSELKVGQQIRIGWDPDRLVLLEYLGESQYEVVHSENSRLESGDKFYLDSLVLGLPLCISDLKRGLNVSMSYIAGSASGLNRLDVL